MDDDYVKIIEINTGVPEEDHLSIQRILDAAKAGDIDIYIWDKSGFAPVTPNKTEVPDKNSNQRVIDKEGFYKIEFCDHQPFRTQFYNKLKGAGEAIPPLNFVDKPIRIKDMFVLRSDLDNLKNPKPSRLIVVNEVQSKFKGKKKRANILAWMTAFSRYTNVGSKGDIATMITQNEVLLANKAWRKLYGKGENKYPKHGHIKFIKKELLKTNPDITKGATERISAAISPNFKGGSPKSCPPE